MLQNPNTPVQLAQNEACDKINKKLDFLRGVKDIVGDHLPKSLESKAGFLGYSEKNRMAIKEKIETKNSDTSLIIPLK